MIKQLLRRSDASVFVGVHSAIGAKIAEESSADGLWISSFELHGDARLPDADILGTADYIDVINKIVDRSPLPLLVDGNAGGGNAINTIRLVREFERVGAQGICIEDNPFPKRCSFYDGMQEELELTSTFCGKLEAALHEKTNSDFAVIARTEALNKNLGLEIALERAKAYADTGVDAILIHDKAQEASSVLAFADTWYQSETTPLVCVPTTYNEVTYGELNDAGFRLVIFANYGLRAIVKALQTTFGAIMAEKHLADGNEHVASMDEIFRLIYVDELRANEARYVR